MTQVFLITERDDLRNSLSRYLRFKEGIDPQSRLIGRPVHMSVSDHTHWVPRTFQEMAKWLESCDVNAPARSPALFNALAIVEAPSLYSLADLDPLNTTRGWSAVLGMLLLAFPEVHWVIISPYQPRDHPILRRWHFPRMKNLQDELCDILKQHNEGFSALFDPAGLRQQVRVRMSGRSDTAYVPLRRECAASIDDEESYAYLNAYICYRFGFRGHIVTSNGMLNRVMTTLDDKSLTLSFEDLYLNFADKRHSLSTISIRDQEFQTLKQMRRRIFVTGGHEGDAWDDNMEYLRNRWQEGIIKNGKDGYRLKLRREHRPSDNPPTKNYVWVLYKPESGVFDVWHRSGLEEEFRSNDGKAAGFIWPPILQGPLTNYSHSAPGRLLLIADRMISRAEHILRNAESVHDAVRGATLALEAEEYLGYRTPTTSLDAVALKHQLEVFAECMFYGVEYHLDTTRRFAEIENEMESVGKWFRSKTREISKVNAKLGIISDLVRTYRNFNQFDEEQAGLSKLRHLYRTLWFRRNKKWAWLFWVPRWYIDHLLNSLSTFGVVILGWLLVFGTIYGCTPHAKTAAQFESTYFHGFEDAIVTFFGLQPPHELFELESRGPFIVWITMVLIIMSFLHLGIFVSHLYALMTRR